MMKTLVVGGSGFLGGAIVDAALAAGHDVTILTRGKTNRAQSLKTKILTANRYGSLDILKDQNFDLVFDTCAYTPDAVENLLNAVGNTIQRYVMISSISAYGDFSKPQMDEIEPVPDATKSDLDIARECIQNDNVSAPTLGESYGRLKRACEVMAQNILDERAICLRVGSLVGAGDYTDRLTWWVRRIDQGGQILHPCPKPNPYKLLMCAMQQISRFTLRQINYPGFST